MTYAIRDMKWGEPVLGTDSGVVYWSADLTGLKYDESLYSEQDFLDALQDAFQAWEDVCDVDFEMAPAGTSADIDVSCGYLSGSTIGKASYTYYILPGTDQLISADITIDTEPTWSPDGEDGGKDFFACALHEIGHVMGLGHVSDTSEIMNSYLATDVLGDGDIAGAQALYGDDTVGVEQPTPEDPAPEEPAPEEPLPEDPLPEDPLPEEPAPEEPAPEEPDAEEPTKGNKGGGRDKSNGPDKEGHPGKGKAKLVEKEHEDELYDSPPEKMSDIKKPDFSDLFAKADPLPEDDFGAFAEQDAEEDDLDFAFL